MPCAGPINGLCPKLNIKIHDSGVCWRCKQGRPPRLPQAQILPIIAFNVYKYRDRHFTPVIRKLRDKFDVTEVMMPEPKQRPTVKDVEIAVKFSDKKPVAILCWEEQGCGFGWNHRWNRIVDYCYKNQILPMSIDYGFLDHFNAYFFDAYLPDFRSIISLDWPNLSGEPIDWSKQPAKMQAYKESVVKCYSEERTKKPLMDGSYYCLYMQTSSYLDKIWKSSGDIRAWCKNLSEAIKARGFRVAIKTGVVGCKDLEGWVGDDVEVFVARKHRGEDNIRLNANLAVHAVQNVVICSSVLNEFVLGQVPVMTTGRSWFSQVSNVFSHAVTVPQIFKPAVVNHLNRNRYLQWFLNRQAYHEQIDTRFAEILRETQSVLSKNV